MKCKAYLKKTERDQRMGTKKTRKKKNKTTLQIPVSFQQLADNIVMAASAPSPWHQCQVKDFKAWTNPLYPSWELKKVSESSLWAEKVTGMSRSTGTNSNEENEMESNNKGDNDLLNFKYNRVEIKERKRIRGESSGLCRLPTPGDQWTFIASQCQGRGLERWDDDISDDAGVEDVSDANLVWSSAQIHPSTAELVSVRTTSNDSGRIESCQVQSHFSKMFEKMGLDEISLNGDDNKRETAVLLPRPSHSNREMSLHANVEVNIDDSLPLGSRLVKSNSGGKDVYNEPEHWDDGDCSGDEATRNNPNISLNQSYETPASLSIKCTAAAVFRKSEQCVIVALDQNSIPEHWDDDDCSDNEANSNTTQISLTQRHHASLPDQCPSAAVFGKSEQALITTLDQNSTEVCEHWDDDECSDNEANSNTTQISLTQRHHASLPDQCPSEAVFRKSEQNVIVALDQNSIPEYWDDDDCSGDKDTGSTTKFSLTQKLEIPASLPEQCTSEDVFRKSEQPLITTLDQNNTAVREHWDDDDCSDNEAGSNTTQISLTERHHASLPDQCPSEGVFRKSEQNVIVALDQNSIPEHWDDDDCSGDKDTGSTAKISPSVKIEITTSLPEQCASEAALRKSEQVFITTFDQNTGPDHSDGHHCSVDEDGSNTTKISLTQRLEMPASLSEQCTSEDVLRKSEQAVITALRQIRIPEHWDDDDCSDDEGTGSTTKFSLTQKLEIPASLPEQCTSEDVFGKSEQVFITTLDQNSIPVPEHWDNLDCSDDDDDIRSNTKKISLTQKLEIPASLPEQCTSAALFRQSEQCVIFALDQNSIPEHWDDIGCSDDEDAGCTTKISLTQKLEIPASLPENCASAAVFAKSGQVVMNALDQNNVIEHWDDDDSPDEDVRSNTTKSSPSLRHPASIPDQLISATVFRTSEGQSQGKDEIHHGPINAKLSSVQAGLRSDLNGSNKKESELPGHVDASVRVISPELIPGKTCLRKENLSSYVNGCNLEGNESENSLRDDLRKILLNSHLVTGSEHSQRPTDLACSTLSTDKAVSQGLILNSRHESPDVRPESQMGYSSPPEEPQDKMADISGRYSEDASKDSGIELSASATNSAKPTLPTQSNSILTSSSDLNHNPLFTIECNPTVDSNRTLLADSNRALLALSLQLQEEIKIKSQNLHAKTMLLAAVSQSSGQGPTTPRTNSTSSSSQCAAEQTALMEDNDGRVEKVLKKLSMQTARLRFCARNRFPAQISPAKKINPLVVPSSQNQEQKQTQPSGAALEQTQPSGAAPEQRQPSGAAPEQRQPSGAAPEQTQTSGAAPEQTQSSGAAPEQTQPSGAAPEQTQPSGAAPEQTQPSGAAPEQTQTSGAAPEQTQSSGAAPEQTQSSSAALPQYRELSDEELRKILTQVQLASSADNKIMKTKPFPCPVVCSKKSKASGSSSSKEEKLDMFNYDRMALAKTDGVKKWSVKERSIETQSPELPQNLIHPSQLLRTTRKVTRLRDPMEHEDFRIPRTPTQCLLQTAPSCTGFIPQSSQYASAGRMSADTTPKSLQQAAPLSRGFIPQSSQYASAGRMTADTTTKSLQQTVPLRESVQIRNSSRPLSTPSKKFNRMPHSSLQNAGVDNSRNLPQNSLPNARADSSRNLPHSLKRPTNPSALAQAALSGLRVESKNNQKAAHGSKMVGANDVIQQLLTAGPVSRMLTSLKFFPKDRSTSN